VSASRATDGNRVLLSRFESPLGGLVAGAIAEGICLLEFTDPQRLTAQLEALRRRMQLPIQDGENEHTRRLEEELDLYFTFTGRLSTFSVPLVPVGSRFERQVWKAVRGIPYGQTRTYGQIARGLGLPRAFRAVGRANGQNPISILIPCHRVIGNGGKLVGYGGGLWRKERLIELESGQATLPPAR